MLEAKGQRRNQSVIDLDDLDKRLIAAMQKNGDCSHTELARSLGTSKSTVTRRIQRLINEGVVRIVAVVDADMIGLSTSALIGLNVDPKHIDSILEQLGAKPQVHLLAPVTGRYDIVAVIAVASSKELAHFVREEIVSIDGVRASETHLALELKKKPALLVV
jgi:Lrp/AsnC family transcriptional regulator for asnA, asnC and gidA